MKNITEAEVRRRIQEILDGSELNKSVLDPFEMSQAVNPVASPAAPYDQPLNKKFVPQNKREFVVAMQAAVKNMQDSEVPKFYKALEGTMEDFGVDNDTRIEVEAGQAAQEKFQSTFTKKDDNNMTKKDTKEEALVRTMVQKVLKEAWGGASTGGLGSAQEVVGAEDEEDDDAPRRGKTTDEKTLTAITNQVSAVEMGRILGFSAHSSYNRSEQALLNKFLHGLLAPDDDRVVEDALRAKYIKFMVREYISEILEYFSKIDPEVDDPDHMALLVNVQHNPKELEFQMFESDGFAEWYMDAVNAALAESGDDNFVETIKDLELDDIEKVRSIGKGYSRLDQAPKDFSRLARLYYKQEYDEELPTDFDVSQGTGGRRAAAGRASGKVVPPKK
jgi:hypothetical protein